MRFLPSLPDETNLSDVFQRFPKGVGALLDYHDAILRGPSPLTIGERELIAAYVSGLNACRFCYGAHSTYAEAYGIDIAVFDALFTDLETAPVDARMKPVLRYAAKLTQAPHKLVKADVDAILDAGWPEEAVHDAAVATALFNFMNRLIFGLGVADHAHVFAARHEDNQKKPLAARRAANDAALGTAPYKDYGRRLGVIKD
ncbi:MAG: carboxymuconolactone decarboxylase family protein [Pseudomonadota bacterium]